MNPLMSTCQCGCSKPGEVFICRSCDITFKCKDEYDIHNLRFRQEVDIRDIENSLMYTCSCEDEPDITCKVGDIIWIMEAQRARHPKEHHGSSLKPPVEEIDDKHEEEVDKASRD